MGNIEIFNSMASRYETPERLEIAKIISDEIRKHLFDNESKTAIDYGCGTGLVGFNLIDAFKSITFVDASPNMIDEVNAKIKKYAIENVTTMCLDFGERVPKDIEKVDYVMISQTLLHIKNYKPLLENIYELLNENGHLLIIDFDKNPDVQSENVHNGFIAEKLSELLKNIGFIKTDFKTFYHGEKMFINKNASLFILDALKRRELL